MSKKKKHTLMLDGIELEVEDLEFKHPGSDLTEEDLNTMKSPSVKATFKVSDTVSNRLKYELWKARNKISNYKEN